MSRIMQTAALVGAFAATAYAHGRVTSITAEGVEYPGFMNEYLYGVEIPADLTAWSADNGDNGFVDPSKYGSAADIACHLNGKPGGGAATVAAGSTIDIQWGTDVWPESHHGPVLDYLAKCSGDDCSSVSAADLSFFKIAEAGLNDGSTAPGQWASDDLIAAGGTWKVTIPASLAPGQYVLRHEIIALHSAGDANGAQNYPQCFNLEVTGGGSASPAGVTADQLYTPTDAGIQVSIYTAPLTYEIPGPAVWDGASSGDSGPAPGGSSSDAAPAPTSAPASEPASTPSSTSIAKPSSVVPPYGGSNYTVPAGTATGYPTGTSAPYPSQTYAAPSSSSAAPSYTSEVPVAPVSEVPSPSSAPAASTTSAAAPTPTQSYGGDEADSEPEIPAYPGGDDSSEGAGPGGYGASKPLPEGATLKDLLRWLNYYVKKGYQADRVHARDIRRF